MEDKRTLLKQIGWSDELIDKCLSGKIISENKISVRDYRLSTTFEHDITTLIVNKDAPIISDGAHLIR